MVKYWHSEWHRRNCCVPGSACHQLCFLSDCPANSNTDAHTDTFSDTNRDAGPNAYSDANTGRDAYTYSHARCNADSHSRCNANALSDCYPNTFANSDSDPDSASGMDIAVYR
jgi:serine-aspartate repeat-containing protein C/D/E